VSYQPRVLVVDDDRDIRETLVEVLQENGFEAVGASDGVEALEHLRAPEDRWGVVLLDLMMPNMDGRTFRGEQLRDPALSPIPVIVISATADLEQTSEELQVAAHVTKPIPLEVLVQMVSRFCPRPS
jgi:CheY-like chemotaxis protein